MSSYIRSRRRRAIPVAKQHVILPSPWSAKVLTSGSSYYCYSVSTSIELHWMANLLYCIIVRHYCRIRRSANMSTFAKKIRPLLSGATSLYGENRHGKPFTNTINSWAFLVIFGPIPNPNANACGSGDSRLEDWATASVSIAKLLIANASHCSMKIHQFLSNGLCKCISKTVQLFCAKFFVRKMERRTWHTVSNSANEH